MLVQESKKPLKLVVVSLLLIAIVLMLGYSYFYTRDHSVDLTIHGIEYQLGTENSHHVRPESVHLKGTWSRSLKGIRTYQGTIHFASDPEPVPQEIREATVHFDQNGYGAITYGFIETTPLGEVKPRTYFDGGLFANSDFSSVAFMIMEKVESDDGSSGGHWNGGDGLMFAGPATTREQALNLSNELMKKHLTNPGYMDGLFILK